MEKKESRKKELKKNVASPQQLLFDDFYARFCPQNITITLYTYISVSASKIANN